MMLALPPIPATSAFSMPIAGTCLVKHSLDFRVEDVTDVHWTKLTVYAGGRRVKLVRRPGGPVKLHSLPDKRFTLKLIAQASDGRTATLRRTFAPCVQPAITIPAGDPPTTLVVQDLKVGKGVVARNGSTPVVHYALELWSNHKVVDSSYTRGEPFSFALGAGDVIAGFDQGVAGMRVGGRRQVTIPPDLGYGAEGTGPIGPNETLVFVIELLGLQTR